MKKYPVQLSAYLGIKDMGEYLEEWINFYLLQGVEYFVIYDFGSKDHTPEIIQPYIKRGIVEYAYFNNKFVKYNYSKGPAWFETLTLQYRFSIVNAYQNFSKWMCFFDLDEFVYPKDKNKNLLDVLQDYEDFGGLHVNWKMFGDSGEKFKKNNLVIDTFNKRASLDHHENDHCKPISRLDRIDLERTRQTPNAHFFIYKDEFYGVNEHKEKIGMNISPENETPCYHPAFSLNKDKGSIVSCNHYRFKSCEEFSKKSQMHRDAGWYGYGHIPDTSIYNEIEDNEIKRFIPLLKDINLDNYSL